MFTVWMFTVQRRWRTFKSLKNSLFPANPTLNSSGHFTFYSCERHNNNNKVCDSHLHRTMANPLRSEVVRLYKNLLHLGREYPKGGDYFRDRLRAAFDKNRNERNPEKVKELIARGEFVARELEALYYLRKYRAMKKRYYEE